jgi:hypothetical protein
MSYRAIVIDPRLHRVIETTLPEDEAANLAALQALVGGYIEAACRFHNGDVLMVNEEGLLHGEQCGFRVAGWTGPLWGQGVIIGSDGPETRSARTPRELVEQFVDWVEQVRVP